MSINCVIYQEALCAKKLKLKHVDVLIIPIWMDILLWLQQRLLLYWVNLMHNTIVASISWRLGVLLDEVLSKVELPWRLTFKMVFSVQIVN